MKRPQKTAAQLRRANQGNVPGHLDMAALSALTGRADTVSPLGKVCSRCGGTTKMPNWYSCVWCRATGMQP